MPKEIKVAVIGAGIAGLTAAYRLKERGFKVAVFDERIHIGGKVGAHPRRITGNPWPEGFSGSLPDKRRLVGKWRAELRSKRVPLALKTPVDDYLKIQWRRLSRPEQISEATLAAVGLSTHLTVDTAHVEEYQTIGEHHAVEGWTITDDERKFRFNIWIHTNEWGEPRVEITDDVYHEHCYHMYLNWYRNFWQLVRDVGRERSQAFTPMNEIAHLFPLETPVRDRLRTLTSLGSIDAIGDNLLSGVASVPDMFLWFYSLADLVGEPFQQGRYLDWASVHGFLRSRWHTTEQSAVLHEYVLSKAFAIPTYLTSAYAYRQYIEYSAVEPEPMLWILKGNSYKTLLVPIARKLLEKGPGTEPCEFHLGKRVTTLLTDPDGDRNRVVRLMYRAADMRDAGEEYGVGVRRGGYFRDGRRRPGQQTPPDDGERRPEIQSPELFHLFRADYVILALPPKALAELVRPMKDSLPSLNAVRKLQSGVTAALDLHFKRKLPGIPKQHVILRGSRYGLTFFDNSQAWESDGNVEPDPANDGNCTCLSVAATDFYRIDGMNKTEAIDVMIDDLKRFIEFEYEDIDYAKTYLQMNDGEPLFLNEVGSEPWRPGTRTEIPNLFVAGDYCDTEIGIVSVEGAVMSGLLAARAVQARVREEQPGLAADDPMLNPIQVLSPDRYPRLNAQIMKFALAPMAAAAKTWSRAEEFVRHPERTVTPRELQSTIDDALAAPGQLAADWFSLAGEAAQWTAELPYRDEDQT
ncbi:MAG: FAD-dependent oxidoreductase [Burkholderiales bacterium]